jgi:hypothetical protein
VGCDNQRVAEDELLRRLDATLERNAEAFADLQVVIRETATRQERSLQAFERRMERLGKQIEANTARVQAGTDAIWRMLDRWGEGPSPTS